MKVYKETVFLVVLAVIFIAISMILTLAGYFTSNIDVELVFLSAGFAGLLVTMAAAIQKRNLAHLYSTFYATLALVATCVVLAINSITTPLQILSIVVVAGMVLWCGAKTNKLERDFYAYAILIYQIPHGKGRSLFISNVNPEEKKAILQELKNYSAARITISCFEFLHPCIEYRGSQEEVDKISDAAVSACNARQFNYRKV